MNFSLSFLCVLVTLSGFGQSTQCLNGRFGEIALFDSSQVVSHLDIPYGEATHFFSGQPIPLFLDVWEPDPSIDGLTSRPVIVLTHGGSFLAGNRSAMHYQCMEYARRGYVAVTLSYRLGWNCDPNVGIFLCGICGPQQNNLRTAIYNAAQDHRAAMRFIAEHAAEYGIDPEWIFVGGESAGSITTLQSVYWDQEEANSFAPSAQGISGDLNSSGNDLINSYSVKGIVNNCGALFNLEHLDIEEQLPMISFHDENDCVVPYNGGYVIGCLNCTSFPYARGSLALHNQLSAGGQCSELNTVLASLGHCTWPTLNIVRRSSCFMKRVMCEVCTSAANVSTSSYSPCMALGVASEISGCTYSEALNFEPTATSDDGSCEFPNATCPADLNGDGVITVTDLLQFIALYGGLCPE